MAPQTRQGLSELVARGLRGSGPGFLQGLLAGSPKGGHPHPDGMELPLRILPSMLALALASAAIASAEGAAVSAASGPPQAAAGTMKPLPTDRHPPGVKGMHLAGTGSGFFI